MRSAYQNDCFFVFFSSPCSSLCSFPHRVALQSAVKQTPKARRPKRCNVMGLSFVRCLNAAGGQRQGLLERTLRSHYYQGSSCRALPSPIIPPITQSMPPEFHLMGLVPFSPPRLHAELLVLSVQVMPVYQSCVFNCVCPPPPGDPMSMCRHVCIPTPPDI